MNKEKQIEEMAIDVLNSSVLSIEDASDVAKSLYNRGYRKAFDVEDWKEIADGNVNTIILSERDLNFIKKKYTEGEGNEKTI